jgi:hypothetical protein
VKLLHTGQLLKGLEFLLKFWLSCKDRGSLMARSSVEFLPLSGSRCLEVVMVMRLRNGANPFDDLLPTLSFIGTIENVSVRGPGE